MSPAHLRVRGKLLKTQKQLHEQLFRILEAMLLPVHGKNTVHGDGLSPSTRTMQRLLRRSVDMRVDLSIQFDVVPVVF